MPFVDSWDSGVFGANWDSGLQWDVGSPLGSVERYLDLITSEHNQRAKYVAMLAGVIEPFADDVAQMLAMPAAYDLDLAAGVQLDAVGLWVGISRRLTVPLTDIWFSWNVAGLGWNEGSWRDPKQPSTEVVILPDDAYRTLLKARVVNNQWNGTIPNAYSVWDIIFAGTGWSIDILDNGDMTMDFTMRGPVPDNITLALLEGGSFDLKPMGVGVTYGYSP